MALALTARNLWIERGGRPVIADLSFSVAAGEALLLTGPNGAGKTTLLRASAGFLPPAEGSLAITGAEGEAGPGDLCHWLGHTNAVKAALSVYDNLAFWARFLGGDPASVEAALARFGIDGLAGVPAGYLSQGQSRRLGLARLLVVRRPVWLLDEPTVSLDAASTAVLAGVVAEHTRAGGLALVATHLPLGLAGARTLALAPPAAVADERAA
jgi:heme exporter protein A